MTNDEGDFRTLHTPKLVAPMVSGKGEIEYALAVDADGRLHLRLLNSSGGGDVSNYYFEINSALKDVKNKAKEYTSTNGSVSGPDGNNNSPGFVRAVIE